MSASISLLLGFFLPMADSALPKEPSPREQLRALQEEIHGPTEEYSTWVIKKHLNTPGIYEVLLTFRPAPSFHAVPDFLVWRPWKQRRLDPKAEPRILDLRQSAERDLFGFWSGADWAFTVRLSARKYKGESAMIECDQPAGLSGNQSLNGSLGIDGVSKFAWESSQRFDYKVEKKPKPREYIEKLVISGKPVECPCVEAIFPFEVTAETSETLQISLLYHDYFPLRRPVKPSKLKGQIILRLCPTQNWYYVKLRYAERDVGPGWREVSSTAYRGSSQSWLQLTDFDEEYYVQWEKRTMPVIGENHQTLRLVTYPWD